MSINPPEAVETPEESSYLENGIAEFRRSYAARNARLKTQALENSPVLKDKVPALDGGLNPDGKTGREDGNRPLPSTSTTEFDEEMRVRSARALVR